MESLNFMFIGKTIASTKTHWNKQSKTNKINENGLGSTLRDSYNSADGINRKDKSPKQHYHHSTEILIRQDQLPKRPRHTEVGRHGQLPKFFNAASIQIGGTDLFFCWALWVFLKLSFGRRVPLAFLTHFGLRKVVCELKLVSPSLGLYQKNRIFFVIPVEEKVVSESQAYFLG